MSACRFGLGFGFGFGFGFGVRARVRVRVRGSGSGSCEDRDRHVRAAPVALPHGRHATLGHLPYEAERVEPVAARSSPLTLTLNPHP